MNIKTILIGKPIKNEDAQHQAIGKTVGLAVFASDALSSTAYATQEILVVLSVAVPVGGAIVFGYSIPIAIAISLLLVILTISYRQTIFAYPGGGGAYIVARDNLGELPAQVAGAALLVDYILTVAVSISSGVDQIASAFPTLSPFRVEIALFAIAGMTIINLRGVKESGRIFAVPTYFFVAMTLLTLALGAFKYFTGTLPIVEGVKMVEHTAAPLSLFLILYAFSSGTTAVTGVEAVSNGITAFKEPRSKNAAAVMAMMSGLLGVMFIGITLLARAAQAVPSESETIISQIARVVFGNGIFYYLQIAATTVILIMAANTAYADFPRLCALHANDGFLPRQLTFKGSRLVFSWGIMVLAIAAGALVILFDARTTLLIPLYAIGVFLSFTLSQGGMVKRWNTIGKLKPGESKTVPNPHGDANVLSYNRHWRAKQITNGIGCVLTFVVMLVFGYTKFTAGAWLTIILIPTLVFIFFRIHAHYKGLARVLSLAKREVHITPQQILTLVLVDDVHVGTIDMVNFAASLRHPWLAVHFDDNALKTAVIKRKWDERMKEARHPLVMVPAPYRDLKEVCVNYVKGMQAKHPQAIIHIIMGQIIMDSWAAQVLHANTSIAFKLALQEMDGIIVTDVAYQVHKASVDSSPTNDPHVPVQPNSDHAPDHGVPASTTSG